MQQGGLPSAGCHDWWTQFCDQSRSTCEGHSQEFTSVIVDALADQVKSLTSLQHMPPCMPPPMEIGTDMKLLCQRAQGLNIPLFEGVLAVGGGDSVGHDAE